MQLEDPINRTIGFLQHRYHCNCHALLSTSDARFGKLQFAAMPQKNQMLSHHASPQAEPSSLNAHFADAVTHWGCAWRNLGYMKSQSQLQDKLERDGVSVEQPVNSVFPRLPDHPDRSLFSLSLYPLPPEATHVHLSVRDVCILVYIHCISSTWFYNLIFIFHIFETYSFSYIIHWYLPFEYIQYLFFIYFLWIPSLFSCFYYYEG